MSDAFLEACRELQLPENADFNGRTIEGAGVYDVNTRRGMRSSSGAEYLRPALKRANLSILRHARATRIVLDADRRALLVARVSAVGQCLITTTDLAHVPGGDGPDVARLAVTAGAVEQEVAA